MISHINVKQLAFVEILTGDHFNIAITRRKKTHHVCVCVARTKEHSGIKDLEMYCPTCCDEWDLGS